MTDVNGALDWEDTISNDGEEYELLPAGEYNFEVQKFERERFPGSANLGPCNKAALTLRVTGEKGATTVKEGLLLHAKTEWKVCQFFVSIGERQKGEALKMNWNKVPGATGRLQLGKREYPKKDGTTGEVNDVLKFLEPIEKTKGESNGFVPGTF